MSTTNSEKQIAVFSVMNRYPISIVDTDLIGDAVDKMSESHLSALPVVDESGLLVGILSINDLLRLVSDSRQQGKDQFPVYEDSFWMTELIRETLGSEDVGSAMSGSAVTARQEDSMQQVAKLMVQHQIHHVPITSKDGKLVGIVSSIDFVRLAAESI